MPVKPWFKLLLAARKLDLRKGPFTSMDLGSEAEIKPSVASSWLDKFVRWGYAVRSGAISGKKRWMRTYALTEYGRLRSKPRLLKCPGCGLVGDRDVFLPRRSHETRKGR